MSDGLGVKISFSFTVLKHSGVVPVSSLKEVNELKRVGDFLINVYGYHQYKSMQCNAV